MANQAGTAGTGSSSSEAVYCRGESCGQQMLWVECVTRAGKLSRMPLNVFEEEVEVVVLENEYALEVALDPAELKGKFIFLTPGFVRAAVCGDSGPFYSGHHATCPDADSFRRKR